MRSISNCHGIGVCEEAESLTPRIMSPHRRNDRDKVLLGIFTDIQYADKDSAMIGVSCSFAWR